METVFLSSIKANRHFPACLALLICMSAALAEGYRIVDTLNYSNDIYSGRMARLHYNDTLTDSIEAGFGIQYIGVDSLLYLKVETLNGNMLNGTYFTKLILSHFGKKTTVSDSLPMYNEHFSSPGVVDSGLYYWGLTMENVYAVKFDLAQFKAYSVRLEISGSVITDSPDYFMRPLKCPDGIIFAMKDGRRFIVTRDMRTARPAGNADK